MSRGLILLAALLLLVALASAQEINVAIGLGGRPTPMTIFDQIDDGARARAFREVWDAAPHAQIDLADPLRRAVSAVDRACARRTSWLRVRTSRKAISLVA